MKKTKGKQPMFKAGYEGSAYDKDMGVKEGSRADMARDKGGMARMLAAQGRTKPAGKVQANGAPKMMKPSGKKK